MTSKHHKWQTRWRIDLAQRLGAHESGLRVQVSPAGRAEALNGPAVQDSLAVRHGLHNAPLMLRRLLREAEQLFAESRSNAAA